VNDDDRLDEKLQMFAVAVSSTPSLVGDVMRRLDRAPQPVRRRPRRKLLAAACLATAACLVVSVVAWMTICGDDAIKSASIDGRRDGVQWAGMREGQATDPHESTLFEKDRTAGVEPKEAKARRERTFQEAKTLNLQRQARGGLREESHGERSVGATLNAAFREASRSEPQLSDFAGLWRGTAVDKPEDGTSTCPLGLRLTISEDGRLEGVAFDDFAGGGDADLQDVYVVGDRLEFKVRHRTGVQMQVTLGLAADTLKGDGIPIRSDESRCDIVLRRRRPAPPPRKEEPSKP
jgi:hypothetical protein